MVHFTLFDRGGPAWDEILDWKGNGTDAYLISGRFGTYIYRMVMSVGTMHWAAIALKNNTLRLRDFALAAGVGVSGVLMYFFCTTNMPDGVFSSC